MRIYSSTSEMILNVISLRGIIDRIEVYESPKGKTLFNLVGGDKQNSHCELTVGDLKQLANELITLACMVRVAGDNE